jgi:hypothetical protein
MPSVVLLKQHFGRAIYEMDIAGLYGAGYSQLVDPGINFHD